MPAVSASAADAACPGLFVLARCHVGLALHQTWRSLAGACRRGPGRCRCLSGLSTFTATPGTSQPWAHPGSGAPPGVMAPCVSHPALYPRCQHCSGCRHHRCSCRSSVCPPAARGGLAPRWDPLLATGEGLKPQPPPGQPWLLSVVVCCGCWSQPWGTELWVGWGRTPAPGTVVWPEGPSPASHLAPSCCGRGPSAEGDLDAPPGGDRVRSERLFFTVN